MAAPQLTAEQIKIFAQGDIGELRLSKTKEGRNTITKFNNAKKILSTSIVLR